MIHLAVNPLCLFTRSLYHDARCGDYSFWASDGTFLYCETFLGDHRVGANEVAHKLIAANQDALYSRKDAQ